MLLTFWFFRFCWTLNRVQTEHRIIIKNSVQIKPKLKYNQTKLLIRFGLVRSSVFHQITYTPTFDISSYSYKRNDGSQFHFKFEQL